MTASAGASYSTVSYQQQYGACPQTAESGDFEDNPVVIVAPVSYHQRHRQRLVTRLVMGGAALLAVCSCLAAILSGTQERHLRAPSAPQPTVLAKSRPELPPQTVFVDPQSKSLWDQAKDALQEAQDSLDKKKQEAQAATGTVKGKAEQAVKDAQDAVEQKKQAVQQAKQAYQQKLQDELKNAKEKLNLDQQASSVAADAKTRADAALAQGEQQLQDLKDEWNAREAAMKSQADAEIRQKIEEWKLRQQDLKNQANAAFNDVKDRLKELRDTASAADDASAKAEKALKADEAIVSEDEKEVQAVVATP